MSSASFVGIGIATAALVIAIISLVLSGDNSCGGCSNITHPGLGGFLVPVFLSLRDNSVQTLNAGNTWTDIRFATTTMSTNAWSHNLPSIVVANRAGLYMVYLSVQAQMSNPLDLSPACRACNLVYYIRATQQRQGIDGIFEVPGSMTYTGGQSYALSKQFHINATVGDVFRFQFMSACPSLTLQPSVNLGQGVPIGDSFPVSATLLIS